MKSRPGKRFFIYWTLLLSVVSSLIPVFIKQCGESWLDVYSTILSAISTVATIVTLVIAFYFYEKFGLQSKFVEKQTDKVLDLVNLLKGKNIFANSNHGTYILFPSCKKIKGLLSLSTYAEDRYKTILMNPEDYRKAFEKIFEVKRTYWLPKEIKEKLSFIELMMFSVVDDSEDRNKYVRISLGEISDENWTLAFPEITFEKFSKGMYDLVESIQNWVHVHADMDIDFKMEEPLNYD